MYDGSNSGEITAEQKIRVGQTKCDGSNQDWIDGTLMLGEGLKEGRDLAGHNDHAFGIWLAERDFYYDPHVRAALIGMATNPTFTRTVLEQLEERLSWRAAWEDHIKPRLRALSMAASAIDTTTPEIIAKTTPPEVSIDISSLEQGPVIVATSPAVAVSPAVKRRTSPDGDILTEIFRNSKTRQTLKRLAEAKKNGAWGFLVECHGELATEATDATISNANLRLVFPWLSGAKNTFATRFDLTRQDDRRQIKDEIIPIVREREAELRAAPERLAQLVEAARKAKRQAQVIEFQSAAVERARALMPAGEQEIVFHGQRLWPLAENEKLLTGPDYQTLCHAVWWFNDAAKISWHKESRASDIALGIRWMMRFQIEWAATREETIRTEITRFCQVIQDLSVLFEKADGNGECKIPHAPIRIEGACASL